MSEPTWTVEQRVRLRRDPRGPLKGTIKHVGEAHGDVCGGPIFVLLDGTATPEWLGSSSLDPLDCGTDRDQLGRALWNLLAPLHGEYPCWAPGDPDGPTLDLADTDAITGLLPHANVGTP